MRDLASTAHMVRERIDYTAAAVDAAKSVLIELAHILGEYRDDFALGEDGFPICSSGKAGSATSAKGDPILFVESKRRGHDQIRKSQLRWLSAAVGLGLPTDAFLVVEWSVEA